jgi:hypothetical protein
MGADLEDGDSTCSCMTEEGVGLKNENMEADYRVKLQTP